MTEPVAGSPCLNAPVTRSEVDVLRERLDKMTELAGELAKALRGPLTYLEMEGHRANYSFAQHRHCQKCRDVEAIRAALSRWRER